MRDVSRFRLDKLIGAEHHQYSISYDSLIRALHDADRWPAAPGPSGRTLAATVRGIPESATMLVGKNPTFVAGSAITQGEGDLC